MNKKFSEQAPLGDQKRERADFENVATAVRNCRRARSPQGDGARFTITAADRELMPDEVELDLEYPLIVRNRRSRQAARREVKCDVP